MFLGRTFSTKLPFVPLAKATPAILQEEMHKINKRCFSFERSNSFSPEVPRSERFPISRLPKFQGVGHIPKTFFVRKPQPKVFTTATTAPKSLKERSMKTPGALQTDPEQKALEAESEELPESEGRKTEMDRDQRQRLGSKLKNKYKATYDIKH